MNGKYWNPWITLSRRTALLLLCKVENPGGGVFLHPEQLKTVMWGIYNISCPHPSVCWMFKYSPLKPIHLSMSSYRLKILLHLVSCSQHSLNIHSCHITTTFCLVTRSQWRGWYKGHLNERPSFLQTRWI